jgi:hypothetical protein
VLALSKPWILLLTSDNRSHRTSRVRASKAPILDPAVYPVRDGALLRNALLVRTVRQQIRVRKGRRLDQAAEINGDLVVARTEG